MTAASLAWIGRGLRQMLVMVCLAGLSAQAVAGRVTVVLSDDSAPYQEIYQVVRVLLGDAGHEVARVYAGNPGEAALGTAQLTLAVGVVAAEAAADTANRAPVLAVLVPRSWFVKTGRTRLADGGRRTVSAIYVDQPFERQAHLARLAFPAANRVGVLLSTEQAALAGEIAPAFAAQQLELVKQTVPADARLITPLEAVLAGSDLLLAVPDPQIFNRNTAQSIFLTTYRYRIPVQGYSHSLTRAGALLSLHSSPAQIGRQAAEWLIQALQAATPRLPAPTYPAYFSVSVNEQVARSLGIALPAAAELEKRLEGGR